MMMINEGNETFNLTLSNLSNAVFASGNATLVQEITIIDNEMPTLKFKGAPFSVAETGTSIEIPVEITGPTSSSVSFMFEIIDGSTTAGSDYTTPSDLSGTIQAGMTADSLTITITDDGDNEGNETFTVRLKSLNGAVFASGTTLDATVTIEDDEDPELSFKTTTFKPGEEISGGMFEVVVELSGATDSEVTFDIALGGGTATKDEDYEDPASLQGMIPVGSTKASIMIPITSDNLNEGNETFTLTLSTLSGAVFEPRGTTLVQEITIVDNEEPTLKFTSANFSVAENLAEIDVTVTLTGATDTEVTFMYELIQGSAMSGVDFTVPSNLSGAIPVGMTGDTLNITITNDRLNEGNESFTVRLKSLTGAVFASGTMLDATVTIEDDEDPELSFKTTSFEPGEEDGTFAVVVELSGATDSEVTFDIALGGGTAIKDTDYRDPSSLEGSIAIGETEDTIMIPILTDSLNEGNETFNLTLSNLSGAVFEPRGTTLEQEITIVDNEDPTLMFTSTSFNVAETETDIEVTVQLTGETDSVVSFMYEIVADSAVAADYF